MPTSNHSEGAAVPDPELRRLHVDEYNVATIYQDYAETCQQCRNPFYYRLCPEGAVHARDLACYLQKRDGHCIALRHHCHGDPHHVDLPRSFDAVHRLLGALEDGLGLQAPGPAERRGSHPPPDRPIEIIERQPRVPATTGYVVRFPCLWGRRQVMVCRRGPAHPFMASFSSGNVSSRQEAQFMSIRVEIRN